MPRSSSKVFKKRRGNFNQGRRSNSESTVTSDSVPQQFSTSNSNVSASEKKLCNLNNSYKSEFNSRFKNVIVDLNVLAGVFSEAVKCLQCGATQDLTFPVKKIVQVELLNLIYSVIFAVIATSFVPPSSAKLKLGNPAPTK
ncbi:hypothetical protein TNCT_186191 [Trichonephila clavata]|uniref:Uncharacterized protein n=1 Tax=Trichonephila clavata TaxID=2740835 RepID=A0A8X6GCF4_TRICU|nr:hypothetical protein TNCT_186191 [Trichonephila clavata]